jgi:hypothetical protein
MCPVGALEDAAAGGADVDGVGQSRRAGNRKISDAPTGVRRSDAAPAQRRQQRRVDSRAALSLSCLSAPLPVGNMRMKRTRKVWSGRITRKYTGREAVRRHQSFSGLLLALRKAMQWTPGNRGDIQDMRGRSGGRAVPLGIGGFLVVLVLSWLTGTNLFTLLGTDSSSSQTVGTSGEVQSTPAEEKDGRFRRRRRERYTGRLGGQAWARGTSAHQSRCSVTP